MKDLIIASDAKAGEARLINGEWRLALVGFTKTDKNGDYNTVLKWYLPKTREHRFAIIHYRKANGL